MLAACGELGLESKVSKSAYKNLSMFADWLYRLAHRAEEESATEIARQLLDDINYENWLFEQSKDTDTAEICDRFLVCLHGVVGLINNAELQGNFSA